MHNAGKTVSGIAALMLLGCASSLPPLPPGEVMQTVTASVLPQPPTEAQIAALTAKSKALGPEDKARAQALFSTGFQLWQAGDFKAAEIAFRDGVAIDPADASANFYYGDALRRVKGRMTGAPYLQIAAALGGSTAEGLKARGALEELSVPPTKLSEMTAQEKSEALVGIWTIPEGFGLDVRISAVSGDYISAQGQFGSIAGAWKIVGGRIEGNDVVLFQKFEGFGQPSTGDFRFAYRPGGRMDGLSTISSLPGARSVTFVRK